MPKQVIGLMFWVFVVCFKQVVFGMWVPNIETLNELVVWEKDRNNECKTSKLALYYRTRRSKLKYLYPNL
ncbi:MAG: hypothetical protein FWH37_02380 [Candidatus Bathyarchaeota archaeon]|nr:hypothetical protein [Candidatus Termiticorpusculum sp.]